MVDYKLGKIYKICGNGLTYYGSTCRPTLAMRLAKHKENYKCYVNGKYHYVSSFKVLEDPEAYISLVENYPCNSKDELTARERSYIESNECVNKVIPGRTKKEYYEEHKEEIRERDKKYYEINKETIKQRVKDYALQNKELIKESSKKYREKNKDKIKEKKSQVFCCDICNSNYTPQHRARHFRTQKHQEALNNIEKNEL